LESRISALPSGIESDLNPQQLAKLLGKSLRQHFIQSGAPETVKALQETSAAITRAQKERSTTQRNLSDSHGGVVTQVEDANDRIWR
jgi:hypothetical protein